jgi:hypothetical protein
MAILSDGWMYDKLNEKSDVIFKVDGSGIPENDPGWEDSSTLDMTTPDKCIKVFMGGKTYLIPVWLAKEKINK